MIGVGCNQRIIDDVLSGFYLRVKMSMSQFSHVASHVRYKLFETYCISFYGCQLWDFQVRFDVMGADVVRHVGFTLHWLLEFEHAWKNDCSVHFVQNDVMFATM